jgi:hypothetical protein
MVADPLSAATELCGNPIRRPQRRLASIDRDRPSIAQQLDDATGDRLDEIIIVTRPVVAE